MILADMVRRIDGNTGIVIFNENGEKIADISTEIVNESLYGKEIIFPISAKDSTIEIWVDTE